MPIRTFVATMKNKKMVEKKVLGKNQAENRFQLQVSPERQKTVDGLRSGHKRKSKYNQEKWGET